MVADIEEMENLNASEIHARRLNAKEVLMPTNVEIYIFPVAGGPVKLSGRDQIFRRTQRRFQGESDGSQPLNTLTVDGEARNDFWTITEIF